MAGKLNRIKKEREYEYDIEGFVYLVVRMLVVNEGEEGGCAS
jgi:hypothetical protein